MLGICGAGNFSGDEIFKREFLFFGCDGKILLLRIRDNLHLFFSSERKSLLYSSTL